MKASTTRRAAPWLLGLALALLLAPHARAAEYTLVVQPILPPEQTRAAFQPLADYLSDVTGHTIKLVTARNFVTYWETMRRGGYDLILDAAHFTDFRVHRMDYRILAKQPDTVTFSLVTAPDVLVFDPEDLINHTLLTLPSPSLGAVRLAEMFPNPVRQPRFLDADDSIVALDRLLKGEAAAAMVPTPLMNAYPMLNVVTTTEPAPQVALSAAPGVDAATRQAITGALLGAERTAAGRAMLQAINLPGFEAASTQTYDGYHELLTGVWGY
ncbi:PhnD/SsuA/transferrin family substrate-binding protein [Ectothiorhodospiraceae bacterium 2226]|nr:PhnD/SsuA/transferrin family substrate-binding protein [Ectothiorhodospiraceae bacterium 2226]